MSSDLFDYSPIVAREPIRWPGDARGDAEHASRAGFRFAHPT